MSTRIKKNVRMIGVMAACGFCLFLSACSDNKSQDTTTTSKDANQAGSAQNAGSQSPSQTTSPGGEQGVPPSGGGKCDTLLTAKCTACHNTTRICEKLGKKSKARWQRTIDRMTERGAKLNAEEAAALLVCLDNGTKELQSSCH